MALPRAVTALAARQGGCVAWWQLVELEGVSSDNVRWWRARDLLERLCRGVSRIPGAPSTDEQRLWTALLRCGPHALAGAAASCWLHGLEGFERLAEDVVVAAPHRCRLADVPVVTRVIAAADRATVRGIPALSVSRAIIEIAPGLDPKALRVLVDSARRQGLGSVDRLQRRATASLDAPGSRRAAQTVLRVLGSGAFAQESENEREFSAFLATTSLVLAWQVTDLVPGRRLDAVDHAATLVLECDSRLWHTLGSDRDADGLRDLEVVEAAGYAVFHLTLGMIRYAPEETRDRLDAVRAARIAGRR